MENTFIKISMCLLVFTLFSNSCKNKDPEPEPQNNLPEKYSEFSDVSFTGQIQRQDMLDEIITYMKTAHVEDASVELDENLMLEMFNDGTGFSTQVLDTSGKKLGNKTASFFQTKAEDYFKDADAASKNGLASEDTAGVLTGFKADGVSKRTMLVDAKGFEHVQVIAKGLMGATFLHQAFNVYFDDIELDPNNDFEEGIGTTMAHHWDEAYGYFTDGSNFPDDGTTRFWGEYSNKRDPLTGSNETIIDAFIKGRQAILDNDIDEVKAQREIIKTAWARLVAANVIHYLNSGKTNFNNIDKYHALSEGYGFIFGLKAAGYDIDEHISTFETKGLYDITEADLTSMATDLATTFDLLSVQPDL